MKIFSNARVDSLLEKARTLVDCRAGEPLWREFQAFISQNCPYMFLFVPEKSAAVNKKARGAEMDVRGFLSHLHHWEIVTAQRK